MKTGPVCTPHLICREEFHYRRSDKQGKKLEAAPSSTQDSVSYTEQLEKGLLGEMFCSSLQRKLNLLFVCLFEIVWEIQV